MGAVLPGIKEAFVFLCVLRAFVVNLCLRAPANHGPAPGTSGQTAAIANVPRTMTITDRGMPRRA